MSVMTVRGEVDGGSLGVVSPHEHIFIDIRNQFSEFSDAARRKLSGEKVRIGNLGKLSRNPYAVKDNLVIDNEKIAAYELFEWKQAGGNTIVDATPAGIGRNPVLLERMSMLMDVNIIAGCGYYTCDTHPADMDMKTVEEIEKELLCDLTEGIGSTGIKSGIIGEIGTSREIHYNEIKVLKASAMAQEKTGVGIMVHTYPWSANGIEVLKILKGHGASMDKICICHVDVDIDTDYIKKIIDMGAYVEFDNFGKEYYINKVDRGFAGGVFARDIERVGAIRKLVDSGNASGLLITCDICFKTLMHSYGGLGYDHVLSNILPMMRDEGISEDTINMLIRENPARFLNKKTPVTNRVIEERILR